MVEEEGNSRFVEIEGEGWLDRKNRVCMLVKNTNMGKSYGN
jgi:nicotinamide riboside kinase